MRILCFTDNHFCERASIVAKHGDKYTLRLENQLQSINWVEDTAIQKNCDAIICLGDFFDRAQLTDQELTALQDITWSQLPHYFLVGNHESEENDLQYSSTMALRGPNRFVIEQPTLLNFPDFEAAFLPYVVESNRQPMADYFAPMSSKLRILFSHNDIAGIQMGPVVSKTGFSIEELEGVCDCCFNGHLHNSHKVSNKIFNLGNLTGKDFSEDANIYAHRVLILDTATMQLEFIENPYAFNFYKLELLTEASLTVLNKLRSNAVLSIKCPVTLVAQIRESLMNIPNVIEFRIMAIQEASDTSEGEGIESLVVDQYAKFAECCRLKLDNTQLLEEELAEILK